MKKLLFPFISLLAIGLLASFNHQPVQHEVRAAEELSLNSDGVRDAFVLSDKQYSETESFVYTADLHFRSGQAGGLVFGSADNNYYFVLNMDRYDNVLKFMYFGNNGASGYDVEVLREAPFIGNDKMNQAERNMVSPRVRDIESVNLKVVVTIEDEHAYMEYFVEGIKRFGIDTQIDLKDLGKPYSYHGGYLGLNCFNADVYLSNICIGKSDYSYYSEPYRNQYHFSSFAKWTNDPNALCYYNGYYHIYYQTNPYGLLWGDMYWGHARSRDLIHFEQLPICLFPETETEFGPGNAFMWSGCAIAYYHGMSAAIDEKNWFPNGGGNGMLAIFTRDGGLQDQVIISSDDDGMTWTKRQRIPQNLCGYDYKVDWRDPKVFALEKSGDVVTRWGMTLSSYNLNKGWFLQSTDLLDWKMAGSFSFPTPECIGVGILKDKNNNEHAYLTNKSRTYILGSISYDNVNNKVVFKDEKDVDISTYTLEQMPLKPLDNGPDSYASQSFYIDDTHSEFYGKDIVLNWFSGDLNASFCTGPGEYAGLRGSWNGGFTIPVEYGVDQLGEEYVLTQKPITVGNENLTKANVVNVTNQAITSESQNPLADVHTKTFEMIASIKTNDDKPITFKVNVGDDEYMQIGWNTVDGYYVDRTYLDDKGINTNVDWHTKYASHVLGDSDVKTFYVLSDNNGLEVFCEDYAVPFYFVTTASMYSNRATLRAEDALIEKLEVNEVASIWEKDVVDEEGILYVSSNNVELDTSLSTAKYVTCWFSGHADLEWELLSGEDVIEYTTSNQGVNVVAKQFGEAELKVSVGNESQTIHITVTAGVFTSSFTFEQENIVSGQWVINGNTIVGTRQAGNGFILTKESGDDFTYTGKFDIVEGTAGALVFRASPDMSSYLVANYDKNERAVKLWSTHGELARSSIIEVPATDISLTIKAVEKDINITINGINAIQYTLLDNEPLSGYFGLNVYSGKVSFKSLSLLKENYEYSAGELYVPLEDGQFVTAIYNLTLGNRKIDSGFYTQNAGTLRIKESYFNLLENGKYQFKIVGSAYTFTIRVEVNHTVNYYVDDVTVESNVDASVYIGNLQITSLKINNEEVAEENYSVKDYTLHIKKECLKEGDNKVLINDDISFIISVVNKADITVNKELEKDYTPLVVTLTIVDQVAFMGGAAVLIVFIVKKKKGVKIK